MTTKETPVPERRRSAVADPLGPNSEIGRKLRQYYNELVSDEVPDRFSSLLAKLDSTESTKKRD